MLKRLFLLGITLVWLLAACSSSPAPPPPAETKGSLDITVYRSPL